MKSYTVAEAAFLTGLPIAAIRRAIEDSVVPSRRMRSGRALQRKLSNEGLLCLKLQQLGVGRLPLAHRRRIYRAVIAQPGIAQVKESEAVVIEVRKARTALRRAVLDYEKARLMVVEDPAIMGGMPVFRGTRIPVHLIAEIYAQGADAKEILEGYPSLTAEGIQLARLYAQAHPRRGPKREQLPPGSR
jgi:uncharacterized protein (DUF433 family)